MPMASKNFVNVEWLKELAQETKHIKQKSYELMQIQPDSQVLDVGCGPAIDTIPLSEYIGDEGRVVGVDYDPLMIEVAKRYGFLKLSCRASKNSSPSSGKIGLPNFL